MSRLGALANKIDRLETTLHELTEALVRLQVASLERTREFNIDANDIEVDRAKMLSFLSSVSKSLLRDTAFFALTLEERTWQAIARGLLSNGNSADDWHEDLAAVIGSLERGQLRDVNWSTIQQVLGTLDAGITDDMRRIEGW